MELFTLILEPSQEPLSRALRESEVIFTCNSDFKRVPSPLGSGARGDGVGRGGVGEVGTLYKESLSA